MKPLIITIIITLFYSCVNVKDAIIKDFEWVNADSIIDITSQLDITIPDSDIIKINVPDFDYKDAEKHCSIDLYFDSIFVVPLETNENCIIGEITQLEIVNDTIYIRDWYKTKNICVFDMNGRFICQIGNIGQGPAEYIEPSDMHVTRDAIFVLDQWQHKLIKYKHDGTFISEHRLPFICQQVIALHNNMYLFRSINAQNYHLPKILDYQFWLTDSTFTIKKTGLYNELDKYILSWNSHFLRRGIDHTYYYDEVSSIVYNIDSIGNITPKYKFEFPHNHPNDFCNKKTYNINSSNNGDYIDIYNLDVIGGNVCYRLSTRPYSTLAFSDVNDNSVIYYTTIDFIESYLNRLFYITNTIGVYNDFIISNISAEETYNRFKYATEHSDEWWNGAPEWVKEYDNKIGRSIKEDDNDILIFGRLKKNIKKLFKF